MILHMMQLWPFGSYLDSADTDTARPRARLLILCLAIGLVTGVLRGWVLLSTFQGDGRSSSSAAAVLQAPNAAAHPHWLEAHGDLRADPYFWLRDDRRDDPAVLAHLHAESSYTRAVMADTEALQEKLFSEMKGRMLESSTVVPVRRGGYWHYTCTKQGDAYRVHCRRKVAQGTQSPTELDVMDDSVEEEVVLDENAEAAGQEFYDLGSMEASPDGRLLAYEDDTRGDEAYTLRIKDLKSGKQVDKPIHGTDGGGAVWANDNMTFFYLTLDATGRASKVWRHEVGTDPSTDALAYTEEDEGFDCSIYHSRSGRLLYLSSGSKETSEVRYLSADAPREQWRMVWVRKRGLEYEVADRGDHLFITLRDEARPNSELKVAPLTNPSAAKVLLPHREDVELEFVEVTQGFLAAFERRDGLRQAVIYRLPERGRMPSSLDEGQLITFDEPAYELSAGAQGDFDSPVLRLLYTSLATPDVVIDYNMATGMRAVKHEQDVADWYNNSKYTTERIWATAADGVRVPISLLFRKDLASRDGSDPLLLDAYGAYGSRNDPYFSASRMSLVDRGFTFAIAHVRGGGELGQRWYDGGRYLDKINTFTDFIACAEHLIAQKYTAPQRLCIQGRSAGGLTMGAVLNMRPDLFGSAFMGVPFVDVLSTMLDESLPRTVIEYEEWGSPRNLTFYNYIKSYSPYDNIRAASYPPILATAGLYDTRVSYWEPAKYVAKLRKLKTNSSPVLLKVDFGAGHFSLSGRYGQLNQTALEYAFFMKCLGMLQVPLQPSV